MSGVAADGREEGVVGTTGSESERGGGLADDRALLGRTSTAERVADILRTRIAEGFFRPGTRLSEDSIGGALGCRAIRCARRSGCSRTSGCSSTS